MQSLQLLHLRVSSSVLKTQRLQNRFKWFLCLLCVTAVNILFAAGGSTQIQNQRNPTVNGTAQESSLFSARFGFTGDPRVNESEVFTLHWEPGDYGVPGLP